MQEQKPLHLQTRMLKQGKMIEQMTAQRYSLGKKIRKRRILLMRYWKNSLIQPQRLNIPLKMIMYP